MTFEQGSFREELDALIERWWPTLVGDFDTEAPHVVGWLLAVDALPLTGDTEHGGQMWMCREHMSPLHVAGLAYKVANRCVVGDGEQ